MSPEKLPNDDPRFQRSLSALLDAVVRLVQTTPIKQISIKTVVEAAGVTRPTFYTHFRDVPDAIQKAALDRVGKAFPGHEPGETEAFDLATAREEIRVGLVHLAENRLFYLRVIDAAATVSFFDELVQFVEARMLPTVAGRANADVFAGGAMWMVVRWMRGQIEGTPDMIADRLAGIAASLHQK